MDAERILVVDDSEVTLEVLERNLTTAGYSVTCATRAAMALDLLDSQPFDLLVTDLKMPGMGGMELARRARERCPDLPCMMITGYATVPGAVEALRSGVAEYLAKPFTKGELCKAVDRVFEKARAARSAGSPPRRDPRRRFGLLGASPAMAPVYAALDRAAASAPTPVLFVGEPGSGRTTAARGLAEGGPFVAEPCASLATVSPKTLLARAAGGALLLQNLDQLPAALTAVLARFLLDPAAQKARLLATASPTLSSRVESGRFSRELYEALARDPITMPPLRERRGDVTRLLVALFHRALGPAPLPCWPLFSASLVEALEAYPWPGNVAELEGVGAHLLARFVGRPLEPGDLPERLRAQSLGAGRTLAEVEADHIRRVLDRVAGNKSRAAEILGINRKTLGEKLKAVGGE